MSKDILVFLPSRNSPGKLERTVMMLNDTAESTENFDIFCVIDDDQEEMHEHLFDKYENVKFEIIEHNPKNFSNIEKCNKELVEKTDYYFNWWISDDFYGLHKNWDRKILDKKNIFDDGYYTLFTNNPMSRNLNAAANGFRFALHPRNGYGKPMVTEPADLIIAYHEMLTLCTKKWRLATHKMNEVLGGTDQIFLNASLVHLLSKGYGYSRNIEVDFYFEGINDNFNASEKTYENGLKRDQFFFKWSKQENFKRLFRVVDDIAKDIWQHYRDRMDKPRGIGKYAKRD